MFIDDDLSIVFEPTYRLETHTGEHMKFLLALTLLSSVSFAESHEAKHEEKKEETVIENAEVKKEEHTAVAPNHKAIYKAVKSACLKENKDLKGKELKDCIISKSK